MSRFEERTVSELHWSGSSQGSKSVKGKGRAVAVVNDSVSGQSEPRPGSPQRAVTRGVTEGLCSKMLRIRPRSGEKGSAPPRQSPSHGFAATAPFTQGGLWPLPLSAICVQFDFAHLEHYTEWAEEMQPFFPVENGEEIRCGGWFLRGKDTSSPAMPRDPPTYGL